MSKLYNAISRLDELAIAQEICPAVPDIPFGQAHDKSGSSLLRMLILSAALILFGLLAVGITAWWQDWFDLHQTTNRATLLTPELPPVAAPAKQQTRAPEQVDAVTPLSGEIGHPLSAKDLPSAPLQKGDQLTSSTTSMADEASAIVINRLPAKAIRKMVDAGPQHHLPVDSITEPRPLQLGEQVDFPTTATGRFIDQTAQLSRWLHQAEQRRRAGDWNGAIALFTKVWEISGNPGVANNLAASLMQVDRLPEAEKILTKALRQAPNDQDLHQNLRVVQQLADK